MLVSKHSTRISFFALTSVPRCRVVKVFIVRFECACKTNSMVVVTFADVMEIRAFSGGCCAHLLPTDCHFRATRCGKMDANTWKITSTGAEFYHILQVCVPGVREDEGKSLLLRKDVQSWDKKCHFTVSNCGALGCEA